MSHSAQASGTGMGPGRRDRAPGADLAGVCLEFAAWTGIPTWLPRVGFIVAAANDAYLAIAIYALLAVLIRLPFWRRLRAAADIRDLPPPRSRDGWSRGERHSDGDASPLAPAHAALAERFRMMEMRTALLERAATSEEIALRRRFNELGR